MACPWSVAGRAACLNRQLIVQLEFGIHYLKQTLDGFGHVLHSQVKALVANCYEAARQSQPFKHLTPG